MAGYLDVEIMNAKALSCMKVLEHPIYKSYLYLASQFAKLYELIESEAMELGSLKGLGMDRHSEKGRSVYVRISRCMQLLKYPFDLCLYFVPIHIHTKVLYIYNAAYL